VKHVSHKTQSREKRIMQDMSHVRHVSHETLSRETLNVNCRHNIISTFLYVHQCLLSLLAVNPS